LFSTWIPSFWPAKKNRILTWLLNLGKSNGLLIMINGTKNEIPP
jgi:hypothetical protein